jgi:hypothetical protein
MLNRQLAAVAFAAALGAPAVAAAQSTDTTKKHDKPVTTEQVAKNTEAESKRVANRTGKAVRKAGRQTEAQAKRTTKSVKRVYSRKARQEARGEKAAADSATPPTTSPR